jgi:hypothetical protein
VAYSDIGKLPLAKSYFSKFFPRKIPFFPNILGRKIFRGIFPEIFPGKNVRKIGPRNDKFLKNHPS